MQYKAMMELIAIEKTDEKAIYEVIGPNDPIDLFEFKDPMGVSYIYCKCMDDGFRTIGSYKRHKDANITSVLIINHLN